MQGFLNQYHNNSLDSHVLLGTGNLLHHLHSYCYSIYWMMKALIQRQRPEDKKRVDLCWVYYSGRRRRNPEKKEREKKILHLKNSQIDSKKKKGDSIFFFIYFYFTGYKVWLQWWINAGSSAVTKAGSQQAPHAAPCQAIVCISIHRNLNDTGRVMSFNQKLMKPLLSRMQHSWQA